MRNQERGAILGIVLVLLIVLLLAAGLAVWGLRSETASAGSDRTARALLDCAEAGLAWGKANFSATADSYNSYLGASNICTFTTTNNAPSFTCPPFGSRNSSNSPGTSTVTGYPNAYPFTQTMVIGNQTYEFTVGIYDNADDVANGASVEDYLTDRDNTVIVYSRCFDPISKQTRSVAGLIKAIIPLSTDYKGQAGHGFRNSGNAN
jgi:hypothetical protein